MAVAIDKPEGPSVMQLDVKLWQLLVGVGVGVAVTAFGWGVFASDIRSQIRAVDARVESLDKYGTDHEREIGKQIDDLTKCVVRLTTTLDERLPARGGK
jgi:hypothetical protein